MHEAVRNLGRVCLSCKKVRVGEGGSIVISPSKNRFSGVSSSIFSSLRNGVLAWSTKLVVATTTKI